MDFSPKKKEKGFTRVCGSDDLLRHLRKVINLARLCNLDLKENSFEENLTVALRSLLFFRDKIFGQLSFKIFDNKS